MHRLLAAYMGGKFLYEVHVESGEYRRYIWLAFYFFEPPIQPVQFTLDSVVPQSLHINGEDGKIRMLSW